MILWRISFLNPIMTAIDSNITITESAIPVTAMAIPDCVFPDAVRRLSRRAMNRARVMSATKLNKFREFCPNGLLKFAMQALDKERYAIDDKGYNPGYGCVVKH